MAESRLERELIWTENQVKRLTAENAKLRAALQEIADEIQMKHPVTIALEALKETK